MAFVRFLSILACSFQIRWCKGLFTTSSGGRRNDAGLTTVVEPDEEIQSTGLNPAFAHQAADVGRMTVIDSDGEVQHMASSPQLPHRAVEAPARAHAAEERTMLPREQTVNLVETQDATAWDGSLHTTGSFSLQAPVFKHLPATTFDGSDRCFGNAEGSAANLPTGAHTIEAEIKPRSDVHIGGIIGWGHYGEHNKVNALRMHGTHGLMNYWWSNDLTVTLSKSLADDQFHHVAVTYDGTTTRKVFVDYALVKTQHTTGYAATDKSTFCIGRTGRHHTDAGGHVHHPENFKGEIRNVRIYNYARTPTQANEPAVESVCQEECLACDSAEKMCKECGSGRYLSKSGECLEQCPPGEYEAGSGEKGRTCQRCDGQTRRRRAKGENSCHSCPNGFVGVPGADECHNIQDECSPEQCMACAACMDHAKPHLSKCVKTQYPSAKCVNFNEIWCSKFQTRLLDCEAFSWGCYFKILCHSPCICSDWKNVKCGGSTSGHESECTEDALAELANGLYPHNGTEAPQHEALMMRRAREVSSESSLSASLDDSLVDKRSRC